MERWLDHTFESSSFTTEEFKAFTRDYKAWIKDNTDRRITGSCGAERVRAWKKGFTP